MTHLTWLADRLATGGAFIFYFRDAPTLLAELARPAQAPAVAYLFLGIFTATTYMLGGIAREQVCIYMCPWPRIQGAMVDHESLLVTYRDYRGEPRGPHKKGQRWEGRGDCIDCKACVAVCPTGIDIRDGSQLECIQCALCIDACNDIMDKVDRPRGLIAYDTIAQAVDARRPRAARPVRFVRARTRSLRRPHRAWSARSCYGAAAQRPTLEINVLHDRNPLFVRLSDGGMRNGYTVKILNKLHEPRVVHARACAACRRPAGHRRHEQRRADPLVRRTDDLREMLRARHRAARRAGARSDRRPRRRSRFVVPTREPVTTAERTTRFQRCTGAMTGP